MNINNFPTLKCKIMYPEHDSSFLNSLTAFHAKDQYLDLVFICKENVCVQANKIVFMTVSGLIFELIRSTNVETMYVSLPDIESKTVELLQNFIYEGVTKVNLKELMLLRELIGILRVRMINTEIKNLNGKDDFHTLGNLWPLCSDTNFGFSSNLMGYNTLNAASGAQQQPQNCPATYGLSATFGNTQNVQNYMMGNMGNNMANIKTEQAMMTSDMYNAGNGFYVQGPNQSLNFINGNNIAQMNMQGMADPYLQFQNSQIIYNTDQTLVNNQSEMFQPQNTGTIRVKQEVITDSNVGTVECDPLQTDLSAYQQQFMPVYPPPLKSTEVISCDSPDIIFEGCVVTKPAPSKVKKRTSGAIKSQNNSTVVKSQNNPSVIKPQNTSPAVKSQNNSSAIKSQNSSAVKPQNNSPIKNSPSAGMSKQKENLVKETSSSIIVIKDVSSEKDVKTTKKKIIKKKIIKKKKKISSETVEAPVSKSDNKTDDSTSKKTNKTADAISKKVDKTADSTLKTADKTAVNTLQKMDKTGDGTVKKTTDLQRTLKTNFDSLKTVDSDFQETIKTNFDSLKKPLKVEKQKSGDISKKAASASGSKEMPNNLLTVTKKNENLKEKNASNMQKKRDTTPTAKSRKSEEKHMGNESKGKESGKKESHTVNESKPKAKDSQEKEKEIASEAKGKDSGKSELKAKALQGKEKHVTNQVKGNNSEETGSKQKALQGKEKHVNSEAKPKDSRKSESKTKVSQGKGKPVNSEVKVKDLGKSESKAKTVQGKEKQATNEGKGNDSGESGSKLKALLGKEKHVISETKLKDSRKSESKTKISQGKEKQVNSDTISNESDRKESHVISESKGDDNSKKDNSRNSETNIKEKDSECSPEKEISPNNKRITKKYFTEEKECAMQVFYNDDKYPTMDMRNEIAAQLDVPVIVVSRWFAKERYKEDKALKKRKPKYEYVEESESKTDEISSVKRSENSVLSEKEAKGRDNSEVNECKSESGVSLSQDSSKRRRESEEISLKDVMNNAKKPKFSEEPEEQNENKDDAAEGTRSMRKAKRNAKEGIYKNIMTMREQELNELDDGGDNIIENDSGRVKRSTGKDIRKTQDMPSENKSLIKTNIDQQSELEKPATKDNKTEVENNAIENKCYFSSTANKNDPAISVESKAESRELPSETMETITSSEEKAESRDLPSKTVEMNKNDSALTTSEEKAESRELPNETITTSEDKAESRELPPKTMEMDRNDSAVTTSEEKAESRDIFTETNISFWKENIDCQNELEKTALESSATEVSSMECDSLNVGTKELVMCNDNSESQNVSSENITDVKDTNIEQQNETHKLVLENAITKIKQNAGGSQGGSLDAISKRDQNEGVRKEFNDFHKFDIENDTIDKRKSTIMDVCEPEQLGSKCDIFSGKRKSEINFLQVLENVIETSVTNDQDLKHTGVHNNPLNLSQSRALFQNVDERLTEGSTEHRSSSVPLFSYSATTADTIVVNKGERRLSSETVCFQNSAENLNRSKRRKTTDVCPVSLQSSVTVGQMISQSVEEINNQGELLLTSYENSLRAVPSIDIKNESLPRSCSVPLVSSSSNPVSSVENVRSSSAGPSFQMNTENVPFPHNYDDELSKIQAAATASMPPKLRVKNDLGSVLNAFINEKRPHLETFDHKRSEEQCNVPVKVDESSVTGVTSTSQTNIPGSVPFTDFSINSVMKDVASTSYETAGCSSVVQDPESVHYGDLSTRAFLQSPACESSAEEGGNSSSTSALHHWKKHRQMYPKTYDCVLCGQNCHDIMDFISHMKTHAEDGKFNCESCKSNFSMSCFMNHLREWEEKEINHMFDANK